MIHFQKYESNGEEGLCGSQTGSFTDVITDDT